MIRQGSKVVRSIPTILSHAGHQSVATIMRCPHCSAIFWERQRALEHRYGNGVPR